jgi:hypothetical protein
MNNPNDVIGSKSGLSTIQRARFGPGMLLQHEDLELLNTYTRDLTRLLFQSFFGCGVICGLRVSALPECGTLKVTVEPGVALSCAGDPVYVPASVDVLTKDTFNVNTATDLWVELCGTSKCCAPRTTSCSCDDDEATTDCTREKDGFEIRLLGSRPKCACACPEPAPAAQSPATNPGQKEESECKCVTDFTCHQNHYDGICGCSCGECSGCDCKCILLAHLKKDANKNEWLTDYTVRRFIRPVLMRDPAAVKPAGTAAGTASAQTIDPLLKELSARHTEMEMARIRESLNCFSEAEKGLLVKVVAEYPRAQKATQLRAILDKYHEVKLAPAVPLQRKDLISRLNADLAEARKQKAASKTGKTKP